MKVTDAALLQTALDEDITWRRREVSSLISLAKTANLATRDAILRATIPVIYAHWEGYVRTCFLKYFEYVSYKRIKFSDLGINFLYLSSRSDIRSIGNGPEIASLEALTRLLDRLDKRNADPMRKHVNTKSNLRWEVLCDIFAIAGIGNPLGDDSVLINKELCDARNEIAHGHGGRFALERIVKLRDEIFSRLDLIKNEIISAAVKESFRSAA